MKKADIAIRIHQQAGISLEEAARLLDHILEFIKTTLQGGDSITISGFGKFTVRNKHARPGRNVRTGETIMIPARRVVTFKSSLEFKREINSSSADKQEGSA